MNVDIYTESSEHVGTITLPDGKVSTAYLKANWPAIIVGMAHVLPLDWVKVHFNTNTGVHMTTDADAIQWLSNPKNWKRGHKGKLKDGDGDGEYWGIPNADPNTVHRMFWTDEFADGMDLNFMSAPKDASLLSIHLHSD